MITDTLVNLSDVRESRAAEQEALAVANEPTFTREEFEAKCAAGYAAGIEEGRAAAFKEAYDTAYTESYAVGTKRGAAAARTRCMAIILSDQAKGRDDLALALACDTDLPAEQALSVLGKSPRTATHAASTSNLVDEMVALSHPNIGRDGVAGQGNGSLNKFEEGAMAARSALGI